MVKHEDNYFYSFLGLWITIKLKRIRFIKLITTTHFHNIHLAYYIVFSNHINSIIFIEFHNFIEKRRILTHTACIIVRIMIFDIFQFGWLITISIDYTCISTVSCESLPIRVFNMKIVLRFK